MLHCIFTITLAANEFLQVGTCDHRNCLQHAWIHTDCSRADSFESKTLTMGLVIQLSQHFPLFKPLQNFLSAQHTDWKYKYCVYSESRVILIIAILV